MGDWQKFSDKVNADGGLNRRVLKTLQINVGKLCNQVCLHCHVGAGPNKKRENMGEDTFNRIFELLDKPHEIETVDLTGGAPELNQHFRKAVTGFREKGLKVLDRCNLTVLFEKGQEDTPKFLADHQVDVIASLPCYSPENVEKQRGDGVFYKSIKGLRTLNSLGYGAKDGPSLNLVYNPSGPFLPPDQKQLEADYKQRLDEDYGIFFNELYAITNMPIQRFLFDLKRSGKLLDYMQLLVANYNTQAKDSVMCRSVLSVSWDGYLYDCDFNQMLGIPVPSKHNLWDLDSFKDFSSGPIALGDHCYGCTAGTGSSCGGSLV